MCDGNGSSSGTSTIAQIRERLQRSMAASSTVTNTVTNTVTTGPSSSSLPGPSSSSLVEHCPPKEVPLLNNPQPQPGPEPSAQKKPHQRPPVAPKPRNKIFAQHQSVDSGTLASGSRSVLGRRFLSNTSFDQQQKPSCTHPINARPSRCSFPNTERPSSIAEGGSHMHQIPCIEITPTNVRSAVAHFDNLISNGLRTTGGPNVNNNESGNNLISPDSSNTIGRPPSGASWLDLKDEEEDGEGVETSSTSTDDDEAETASYKDLSDSADENYRYPSLDRKTSKDEPGTGTESLRPKKKTSVFGNNQLHESAIEELRSSEMFRKNDLRMSERPHMRNKAFSATNASDVSKLGDELPKMKRDVKSQPLTSDDMDCVVKMRHKSDALLLPQQQQQQLQSNQLINKNRISQISNISTATYTSSDRPYSDIIEYSTGDPVEDTRLKRLHYAALEIYTVEKKFVEQLDILAVQYPKFVSEYGKSFGEDLLGGPSNIITSIASQLLMLKGAHSVLLEKFAAKLANWDSREPNLAEVLKNNAGFLKFCLPYLKQKKKFVDELMQQLQTNELLADATAKFEEQGSYKISIIQRLDIVHQNVVRYTILLEAYRKYLIRDSHEYIECQNAIKELSKVSDAVNHQISLAVMMEKLVELDRRLEGNFNVFEANRHLLHEGELMKQSRKDVQPRYLILFSDVLLICKYSRTPTLGSDVSFQNDFYQFSILSVRVKAEEHGEYETHFQLLSTKKSAVFIAKNKRERDDWVKRLNDAKREAKRLRRISVDRRVKACLELTDSSCSPTSTSSTIHHENTTGNETMEKELSDNDASPTMAPFHEKYVAPWIPDPKATTCMMAGCNTKFSILNRRHHCRECGALICGKCVGHAPVKNGSNFFRQKVCPECHVKIMSRWSGSFSTNLFSAPTSGSRLKSKLPDRNEKGIVSGTVFVRNKRFGETQKWGRLIQHSDGAMVLCFYDAEFDPEPYARHVLLGFELRTSTLDEGGELFELTHANQVKGNAISIAFRVPHAGSAEQWNEALSAGLRAFSMNTTEAASKTTNTAADQASTWHQP